MLCPASEVILEKAIFSRKHEAAGRKQEAVGRKQGVGDRKNRAEL